MPRRAETEHAAAEAVVTTPAEAEERDVTRLDPLLEGVALCLRQLARRDGGIDLIFGRPLQGVAEVEGWTPRRPAASSMIALLRAEGESSCVAAIAAPPPATATTAAIEIAILRLKLKRRAWIHRKAHGG